MVFTPLPTAPGFFGLPAMPETLAPRYLQPRTLSPPPPGIGQAPMPIADAATFLQRFRRPPLPAGVPRPWAWTQSPFAEGDVTAPQLPTEPQQAPPAVNPEARDASGNLLPPPPPGTIWASTPYGRVMVPFGRQYIDASGRIQTATDPNANAGATSPPPADIGDPATSPVTTPQLPPVNVPGGASTFQGYQPSPLVPIGYDPQTGRPIYSDTGLPGP